MRYHISLCYWTCSCGCIIHIVYEIRCTSSIYWILLGIHFNGYKSKTNLISQQVLVITYKSQDGNFFVWFMNFIHKSVLGAPYGKFGIDVSVDAMLTMTRQFLGIKMVYNRINTYKNTPISILFLWIKSGPSMLVRVQNDWCSWIKIFIHLYNE